jgi:hypothetical protein
VSQGLSILNSFGITANPVSTNLISFWPSRIRTGPAVINNYFSTDPNTYNSYNAIIKIDHTFNAAHSLSVRYYGGTGTQAAVVDTNAPFRAWPAPVQDRRRVPAGLARHLLRIGHARRIHFRRDSGTLGQ